MSTEGVRVYIGSRLKDCYFELSVGEKGNGTAFTDSELKARDERIARAAFKAGRESFYSGEVDLARAEGQDEHGDEFKYQIVESYINSEEFRKV